MAITAQEATTPPFKYNSTVTGYLNYLTRYNAIILVDNIVISVEVASNLDSSLMIEQNCSRICKHITLVLYYTR